MIYRKLFLILFILTTVTASAFNDSLALNVKKTEFEFSLPRSLEKFNLKSEKISIDSDWNFPEIEGESNFDKKNWKHLSRATEYKVLAGKRGEVFIDVFSNTQFTIIREFWHSLTNQEFAVRQKLTNNQKSSIRLISLTPLSLTKSDALIFDGNENIKDWKVLVQKRLKNGVPTVVTPQTDSPIEIDPFCVFNSNQTDTPNLLIGYLSQTGHLARMNLAFERQSKKTKFSSLTAECQFDKVVVPSGGQRTSQWVYIKAGFDTNNLVEGFAKSIGVYYNIKEPLGDAPNVFCTWYFHGRNYNETYFKEDIKALKENRIPFDVFLIDDCWTNNDWGMWTPGPAFPSGIPKITDIIKEEGYKPGIWTAPYSVDKNSEIALEHPEWLLTYEDGSLVEFGYSNKTWVFDPTFPGVVEHLKETFQRLKYDYGFDYFKVDFMRSVFVFDDVKFYDPTLTRLEAFRMGLEAVRNGIGPDSYLSVCGGHFGGSIGIADSQRSGSDVVSIWEPKQVDAFKQNIRRTWMNRLWHVDADALMIRKRETPFHPEGNEWSNLSLGKLNDNEARTSALNQFIGGGMVCFSEYLKELSPERRELYKNIIPSVNSSSNPLDTYNLTIPSYTLTHIQPKCSSLKLWNMVAAINWEAEEKEMGIALTDKVVNNLEDTDKYIISEFFSQKVVGLFSKGEYLELGDIPFHASKLLHITPWDGKTPTLVGTDLHFSGGGVEITTWKVSETHVEGEIETEWNYPVKITVAFPDAQGDGYALKSTKVGVGQKKFFIEK